MEEEDVAVVEQEVKKIDLQIHVEEETQTNDGDRSNQGKNQAPPLLTSKSVSTPAMKLNTSTKDRLLISPPPEIRVAKPVRVLEMLGKLILDF